MKLFGFSPLYRTSNRKNYILPCIILIFITICLVSRIICGYKSSFGFINYFRSFSAIVLYLDTMLTLILFIMMFYATTKKNQSWAILLEIVQFYPKNKKGYIYKIMFVALSFAYLVIISESTNRTNKNIHCIINWIYIHISHYSLNVLIYFIMEYLLILEGFYKQIYMNLKDMHRKVTQQPHSEFRRFYFNKQVIKEIKLMYVWCYKLLQHYHNVFGWPLGIIVIFYFTMILWNADFALFRVPHNMNVYTFTTIIQMMFPTVSLFQV